MPELCVLPGVLADGRRCRGAANQGPNRKAAGTGADVAARADVR
jgi:hypothetical protein